MSTATHKPKLTGWAAAAAKAAPRTHHKSAHSPPSSTSTSAPRSKAGSPPPQAKDAPRKTKKPQAASFNADEVARFLRERYAAETAQPDTLTYTRSKNKGSPDWGTTNHRTKSKKYGCLSEVARALRS